MTRLRRNSGFTLIELLVVVMIMSMIVVALTAGQRFAVRAWQTQERQIDQQADVGAVQNALRQIILAGRAFDGGDDDLKLVGSLPRGLNRGGLYDIELKTDEDRLIMSWRPHFSGPQAPVEPTTALLAKGVSKFELSYYTTAPPPGGQAATPAPSSANQWQESSRDKSKPPALVKVSMSLSQGRWLPLIVAPMLDAPPVPAAAPPAATPGVPQGPQDAAAADSQPNE